MIKLLFILTIFVFGKNLIAQKTIPTKKVCSAESSEFDFSIKPVESFKDKLTIRLRVDKAFDAYENFEKKIEYTEEFENETSIIKIAPKIAIQISVARVLLGGEKFYLSTINYFLKKEGCWESISESSTWSKMRMGNQFSSNSYNGVGFKGELIIE